MMKRTTTCIAAAGFLWLNIAATAVGQTRPAPAAPPAPPAPPAPMLALPPLPPMPPDFDFDADAFKASMEEFKLNLDDFKQTLKESLKDSVNGSVKGAAESFSFAMQSPRPMPTPPVPFGFRTGGNSPADGLYDSAHELINSGRYDKALDQLERLIRQYDGKSDAVANHVDAALYWKGYVQMKESSFPESLATLADLQKRFSDSRWLKDAKALEVEVRQASGQRVSPDGQSDEELKLLALRGLMQADPDRAVPMIEQIMSGNSSVRVKENALFVLSQSRATRARDLIGGVAKSNSNPDIQLRAVRYLGSMRTPESRQMLDDVYRSSSDVAVKRAIIQSYASSDALDRLSDIAKNEKDVQLKRTAIRNLGSMRRANTGDALKAAYLADTNTDVRKDAISALSNQQNAVVLVELARQEKNPELKREIVSRLSNMKSKEATDYLIELLK